MQEIRRLKTLVDRLRSPDGCPWDLAQTPQSLVTYLIEEAHEAAEAIENENHAESCEELGDLLLNIFLQARIAEEEKRFTLEQIAQGISDKLIRRHPHVFGDQKNRDLDSIHRTWKEIKAQEKPEKAAQGLLRELPKSIPAMTRAQRLGKDAARVGFDWPNWQGPMAKIREEIGEIEQAVSSGQRQQIQAEIGDLLLAVSSLCRHLEVDAETALVKSMQTFRRRFAYMSQAAGECLETFNLEQLEEAWQRAKQADQADQ